MSDISVHLGETLDEFGARFVAAWGRAEKGELSASNAEHHVSFEDFATFVAVMTPKRLALLKHVHRQPARSIRALALAIGRDYRRVHDDVEALVMAGLLDRGPEGLRAEYDTVHIETRLAL